MAEFRPFNWTCPYCNRAQTVTEHKFYSEHHHIYSITEYQYPDAGVTFRAIACANGECKKLSLELTFGTDKLNRGHYEIDMPIKRLRILPESYSKPQPDYIPEAIREDYYEACLIRDKSAKAAATLIRRCLQGMIRDFCGISKPRLIDEIRASRSAMDEGVVSQGVTHESVDAIDRVRKVGNIGAHMEADVNLIVPVDPGEAQVLIELTEMLFEEWYVQRNNRRNRFAAIAAIAGEKEALLKQGSSKEDKPASKVEPAS